MTVVCVYRSLLSMLMGQKATAEQYVSYYTLNSTYHLTPPSFPPSLLSYHSSRCVGIYELSLRKTIEKAQGQLLTSLLATAQPNIASLTTPLSLTLSCLPRIPGTSGGHIRYIRPWRGEPSWVAPTQGIPHL